MLQAEESKKKEQEDEKQEVKIDVIEKRPCQIEDKKTSDGGEVKQKDEKPKDKDEEQAAAVVDVLSNEEAKVSLEEKMKQWESTTAAEIESTRPPERTGAFDIGLYIAFPFMVLASLAFALFPFIMDKIDVSSVGPPPVV